MVFFIKEVVKGISFNRFIGGVFVDRMFLRVLSLKIMIGDNVLGIIIGIF